MIVLLGFAVLAGAGTALSPCVLPVLPALLSAGGVGGRRRPLGIVLGLSITFTVTIVGVAKVVDGVGLGSDPLRDVAIVVLLAFGVALLLPSLAERIEAPLSRLARFGPRSTRRRLPFGPARGRRARLRLHALRQPDPGRGDLRQRRLRENDRDRARLRARLGGRAAGAHAGRQAPVRPRAQGRSRPAAAACAGHDHDPHGGRDPDQPRRQLRPVRGPAHPRRQPHGVA